MDYKLISIADIGLSFRSSTALRRVGIMTVEDLLKVTEEDLFAIRNIGKKSVDEILAKKDEYTGGESIYQKEVKDRNITESTLIEDTSLSRRSKNQLLHAGILTVGDLVKLNEEDLYAVKNLGMKSVDEIMEMMPDFIDQIEGEPAVPKIAAETVDPFEHYEEWLEEDVNRQRIIKYLQDTGTDIGVLDMLSARAYNILMFSGHEMLYQVIFATREELEAIPRMDGNSASEIQKLCKYYIRNNRDLILRGMGVGQWEQESTVQLSIFQMIKLPEYQPKVQEYVRMHDLPLGRMDLSVRTQHCLMKAHYAYLSDFICKSRTELSSIGGMGSTTLDEITGKVNAYLDKHQQYIIAYINGDKSVLVDKDTVRERILMIFRTMGFLGLHFPEIMEKLNFPEAIDESIVKHEIGKLIAEGKLEYIDYLCYRVYPSVTSYLDEYAKSDERGIRYIKAKMKGETLEAIAKAEGLSRERVRQIIKNTIRKLHNKYYAETGDDWFDEDYYRHLYTTYEVDRKVCVEWFGIPAETYNYLDMFNTKGKKDISEALDDIALDVGLRLKISNYLNRNKIFVDGNWIERKRSDLEDYVLAKYCGDELTFDDFVEAYNNFLASQGIPFDEELYYTDETMRSRANRFGDSRKVLWKQFQMLRYYDIDGRDYTELLDTLDLDAYENTELSTLKFFNDYPALMSRYDIRDQYELHNLLRKIVPDGSYHDFHCGRMPGITFGTFDRSDAVLKLLINNAPISQQDMIDLVHEEFGIDKTTIAANWLTDISEYYHKGMYTIAFKVMSKAHRETLKAALTEDFYYMDEVKKIYTDLIPEADPDAINPYNLKAMGFLVLSKYIVQNHSSLEAYFKSLLLRDDVVDIAPLRKRFRNIQMWYQTLAALKNEYEILEFEPNQIVSFSKLEKAGITKDMFKTFCDAVYECMEDGAYFTGKSLRKSGFASNLYELGFSDWFYANLLCFDERFNYCNMLGNIVLHKGREAISIRSFITDLLNKSGRVDILDLMTDLDEEFGCKVAAKSDITQKLQGSDIFYDPILERLYANAELYYRELDEETEGI